MPLAERTGPMGYWKYRTDSPEKTVEQDRAAIAMMQDAVPRRFTATGPPKVDETIRQQCVEIGKSKGIEDGWDFTWLENLLEIPLNTLYRQLIGSCVATSHITLLATKMLHELVLFGENEELLGRKIQGRDSVCPFGPYSYRAGRKYAGINGRGDGSTCSGQIRGTMALGFLPCDTEGLQSDHWPEPKSTGLYRQWGANDSLMNNWTEKAGAFDLLDSEEIRSADDAKEHMLKLFQPLQICSGWGFAATNKRLPNGDVLYTRRGSWSHSMQVQAICMMSDNNWYVKIRNQWGNTHSGKNYFWVTLEEFSKWIRNSNTMSIGDIVMRKGSPDPELFVQDPSISISA